MDETSVQGRKGLHFDLCCVQRLSTEDTCSSPLEKDSEETVKKHKGFIHRRVCVPSKTHFKLTLSRMPVIKTTGKSKFVLIICASDRDKNHRGFVETCALVQTVNINPERNQLEKDRSHHNVLLHQPQAQLEHCLTKQWKSSSYISEIKNGAVKVFVFYFERHGIVFTYRSC